MKITKKLSLYVFGVGSGLFLALLFLLLNNFGNVNRGFLKGIFVWFAPIFYSFPVAFLFSLITYKMNEKVFRVWSIFTYVWIPLSIISTLLIKEGSNPLFSTGPETTAMFMMFLYAVISTLLILLAWFSFYLNDKMKKKFK